jgi:3-mercaptopyruvate sulfurtransferase SseA
MIKVTIVFKNTPTSVAFRTGKPLQTIEAELRKAKQDGRTGYVVETIDGAVYFDPREVAAFLYEKI